MTGTAFKIKPGNAYRMKLYYGKPVTKRFLKLPEIIGVRRMYCIRAIRDPDNKDFYLGLVDQLDHIVRVRKTLQLINGN